MPVTYVVNDNCIACKYTDCVVVCPVDCFYEGENMLVIHPDECIDCGSCEPECPVDAIRPDTEPDMEKWVEFNRKYSEQWPVIVTKKDPLPDRGARTGGRKDRPVLLGGRGRGRLTGPPARADVAQLPTGGNSRKYGRRLFGAAGEILVALQYGR